jgi:hypothetical protein
MLIKDNTKHTDPAIAYLNFQRNLHLINWDIFHVYFSNRSCFCDNTVSIEWFYLATCVARIVLCNIVTDWFRHTCHPRSECCVSLAPSPVREMEIPLEYTWKISQLIRKNFIVRWILNFVDQPTHQNWYSMNKSDFTVCLLVSNTMSYRSSFISIELLIYMQVL